MKIQTIALFIIFAKVSFAQTENLQFYKLFEPHMLKSSKVKVDEHEGLITKWYYNDSSTLKTHFFEDRYDHGIAIYHYNENGNLHLYSNNGGFGYYGDTLKYSYLDKVQWDNNGNLIEFIFWDNGEQLYYHQAWGWIGISVFSSDYDERKFIFDQDGRKTGEWLKKDTNYVKMFYYRNNNVREIVSESAFWHEDAIPVYNGKYRYYHENGKVFIEGQFESNKEARDTLSNINADPFKHGKWKYFDYEGNLIRTENYDYGALIDVSDEKKLFKKFVQSKAYLKYSTHVSFEKLEGTFYPLTYVTNYLNVPEVKN